MPRSQIRFFAVAALAALALAACSSSSKSSSPATNPPATTTTVAPGTSSGGGSTSTPASGNATVKLASSKYGQILVDSKGLTLYVDEKDKPGKPSCTGPCLTIWPPAVAPASPTFGAGLTASMFSSVTLTDGTKQLTVNGSPLYTFTGKAAGDVSGQDVNGFYVVAANGKKYDPGAQPAS